MTKTKSAILGTAIGILILAALAFEIIATQPIRGAVRTCSKLFTVANQPDLPTRERLRAASELCTARYLKQHPLEVAPEGGLVNIPRNLNKNYKAWREGPNVLICTSNRVGPIYQFVYEGDRWRFDGLAGVLGPWGQVMPASDLPEQSIEATP
jgi:hypothetical protein